MISILKIQGEENSKKLNFVNDVENSEESEKTGENQPAIKLNENSDLSDDVVNLRVPEIIWLKTLMHFQNKNISFEMNLKFLSALMKYGKKLNYKILKDKR